MISVSGKNWEELSLNINIINKIKQDHKFSDILSRLIVAKNFNLEEVSYLNHKYIIKNVFINDKDFNNSSTLFINCIKNKEKICILGDYDVDGSTSTALLIRFLKHIKHPHFFYIPDREKDGYGATVDVFNQLVKKEPKLMIMLDCGSNSNEAINFLNKKKIKSIVIDHHEMNKPYPKANYIINPKKDNKSNKYQYLCATALTYFFLDLTIKKMKKKINLENYLIYVLLATVCDVMPLRNLNRFIALNVLKKFSLNQNKALNEIYLLSNKNNKINVEDIGFLIGPILNSGGRLRRSSYATDLLSSDDTIFIKKRAKQLFELNNKRKLIENRTLENIDFNSLSKKNEVIVLYKPNINEGIIGIIAAKLKEFFNKPSLVITNSGNILKGSARSIEGFNLGLLIKNAINQNLILNGGGHEMAAGFSLNKNKVNSFINFINLNFKKLNKTSGTKFYFDFKMSSFLPNNDLFDDLRKMEPFGNGNSEPTFLIQNISIIKPKILNQKHIFCILKSKMGSSIKSISFNSVNNEIGKYLLNYKNRISVIGHFRQNNWNHKNSLQFLIKDLIT